MLLTYNLMSPFNNYSLDIVFDKYINFFSITFSDPSLFICYVTCRPLREWKEGFPLDMPPNLINRSWQFVNLSPDIFKNIFVKVIKGTKNKKYLCRHSEEILKCFFDSWKLVLSPLPPKHKNGLKHKEWL